MNENIKFSERLLKNTQELVFLYNTNGKFRELFDKLVNIPKITFKGQSLRTYVKVIATLSPRYRHFEKEVRQSSAKYSELLTSYYRDQREYPKLLQNLADIRAGKYNLPFSLEELKLMQTLEKIPDDEKKLSKNERRKREDIVNKIHEYLDQKIETGLKDIHGQPLREYHPPISPPRISIPNPPLSLPSAIKTGFSNAQMAAGGFLKNTLPKALSETGKGILKGLGFGGKAAAGLGGAGAKMVTGLGGKAALGAMGPVGWGILAIQNWKIVAYGVAFIIFFFLFIDLSQTGSLFPPPGSLGAATISPDYYDGGSGGDISSCEFTRSDQSPKEVAYQSPRLLSYLQEASRLSGIPGVVLAAFIRVEVPSVLFKTDSNLNSIGCPKSNTGALGLMQLQPKGTMGHDAPAIFQGAKLIGKTYNELTEADYCDLQKNIIMGAGFILKKMSYRGYGDGTKWDPAWTNDKKALEILVDGYYGCHLYGGARDCTGPFNYAEDIWTSIQNCKAIGAYVVSCPVKGPTITCGTAQNPRNGCGHGGTGYLVNCDPRKYECTGDGGYSSLLKSAIDVTGTGGGVYFPTINGEKLTWKKKQTLTLYDDWGIKVFYTTTTSDRHEITLNFTHLNKSPVPKEEGLSGEDIGAALAPGAPGGPHLHLAMMIDGKVVDAIEANLCQ